MCKRVLMYSLRLWYNNYRPNINKFQFIYTEKEILIQPNVKACVGIRTQAAWVVVEYAMHYTVQGICE